MNTALDLVLDGAIALFVSSKPEGPLYAFNDDVAYIGRRFASEKGAIPVAVKMTKLFLPRAYKEVVNKAITIGMEAFERRQKVYG